MRDLTVAEAAYIAGFIDGDGSIGVNFWGGSSQKSRGTAMVSIGQNEREVLDWIQKVIGVGTVSATKTPRGKSSWTLTLYSKNALDLLEAIEVYLVAKADQAGFVLERFGK